jgi:hypothetical protein
MPIVRPAYPSYVLLTHRTSCLPIVRPAYPSYVLLTHRTSCLPIVRPAYPSYVLLIPQIQASNYYPQIHVLLAFLNMEQNCWDLTNFRTPVIIIDEPIIAVKTVQNCASPFYDFGSVSILQTCVFFRNFRKKTTADIRTGSTFLV